VKILESYVAPVEFEIDGKRVKRGTWLLAVRVAEDGLWRQIKSGELTGFSIGGSAHRARE
jgi:DNA adenine methylase